MPTMCRDMLCARDDARGALPSNSTPSGLIPLPSSPWNTCEALLPAWDPVFLLDTIVCPPELGLFYISCKTPPSAVRDFGVYGDVSLSNGCEPCTGFYLGFNLSSGRGDFKFRPIGIRRNDAQCWDGCECLCEKVYTDTIQTCILYI